MDVVVEGDERPAYEVILRAFLRIFKAGRDYDENAGMAQVIEELESNVDQKCTALLSQKSWKATLVIVAMLLSTFLAAVFAMTTADCELHPDTKILCQSFVVFLTALGTIVGLPLFLYQLNDFENTRIQLKIVKMCLAHYRSLINNEAVAPSPMENRGRPMMGLLEEEIHERNENAMIEQGSAFYRAVIS